MTFVLYMENTVQFQEMEAGQFCKHRDALVQADR